MEKINESEERSTRVLPEFQIYAQMLNPLPKLHSVGILPFYRKRVF